jgi:hypothetical protein
MTMSKIDLGLLCLNLFVLGGIVVLMAPRGPSVSSALLAVGTSGMAIAKLGKATLSSAKDDTTSRCR